MAAKYAPFWCRCPRCKVTHQICLNTAICGGRPKNLTGSLHLCYGCTLAIRGTVPLSLRKARLAEAYRMCFGPGAALPPALQ